MKGMIDLQSGHAGLRRGHVHRRNSLTLPTRLQCQAVSATCCWIPFLVCVPDPMPELHPTEPKLT